MSRDDVQELLTILLMCVCVGVFFWAVSNLTNKPAHTFLAPKCQEDEIIQGYGNFEHGRWDHYQCQHPDNLRTETNRGAG